MKKIFSFIAALSVSIIIPAIPTYAAGTIQYSGDIVSFEYPEDFQGTIIRSDTNNGDFYHFESMSDSFNITISEIYFDYYENNLDIGRDEYLDFLIYDASNEYMWSEPIKNSEYPEARQIFKSNGFVQYRKILGESPNGFLLVSLEMPNDNECEKVNTFISIYNSVEANPDWLVSGSDAPEYEKYGVVMYDSAQ